MQIRSGSFLFFIYIMSSELNTVFLSILLALVFLSADKIFLTLECFRGRRILQPILAGKTAIDVHSSTPNADPAQPSAERPA